MFSGLTENFFAWGLMKYFICKEFPRPYWCRVKDASSVSINLCGFRFENLILEVFMSVSKFGAWDGASECERRLNRIIRIFVEFCLPNDKIVFYFRRLWGRKDSNSCRWYVWNRYSLGWNREVKVAREKWN